jgi:pimeloyl-ACP methyl ester carboxylesterase
MQTTLFADCPPTPAAYRPARPLTWRSMGRPQARAGTASLHDQRSVRVKRAFAELPGRYLGAAPDFDATFQIRLGDVGRTWEVRTHGSQCEVRPSPLRDPDVVIGTDASTWLALREGRMSGLDAFAHRRLYARGDLDLALGFEGLFRLPGGRDPLLRIAAAETAEGRISTLIAGDGPEQVICLHGLGSNKASFFETVPALAPGCTVHALDLPGFGSSAKPARAPYTALWFAAAVRGYMDAMAIERAHLVGNSMGGRIALELAFGEPARVATLSLLAPALAFRRRRELVPLVRLLRPELAAIPHPLRTATVREQFWGLFARPERLDPRLSLARGAGRVLRRGAQHLPRRAARRGGPLRPARRPRAAGPVHLGRAGSDHPAGLRSPRRAGPAAGAPGRARRLRPRAPGRAARADQQPDPRPDRGRSPRARGDATAARPDAEARRVLRPSD